MECSAYRYLHFVTDAIGPLTISAPHQLLAALRWVFPTYTFERDDYAPPEFTYHALLEDFTNFFGANQPKFTRQQLAALAVLINRAVAMGGTLEQAFQTCCLERLKRLGMRRTLAALLDHPAKDRLFV